MADQPLKSKNTRMGNVKSAGLKAATTAQAAAGRVKEYAQRGVSAMQQGDTPEESTARFAGEEVRQLGQDVKNKAQSSIKRLKNKGIDRLKKHTSANLKSKSDMASHARETTQRMAKETVVQGERAAQRASEIGAKNAEKGLKTASKMSSKASSWAVKSTAKMSSWAAKSTARMTAWSTKVAAKASAKAAAKTAQTTAKAAQVSAKATAAAAKTIAAAGKVAVTVVMALIKMLIGFIAAGGWVLLLIVLVVVVIWALISGITGMLYTVDDNGDYTALVTEVSSLTETYYSAAENSLEYYRSAYTVGETLPELIFEGTDIPSDGGELFYVKNLHDVMAVFYTEILSGVSGVESLNYLTDERKERLKEIFDDMNSLNISLGEVQEVRTQRGEGETEGELVQYIVRVHVDRKSLTAQQAAQNYGFTEEQQELLAQFMTDDAYALIAAAIGTSPDGSYGGEPIKINPNMPTSMIGYTIVQNAKRYIGRSYSSMDCSALVRKAYQDTGFDWEGTSTAMGKECVSRNCIIDRSQLMPGDLIFWKSDIGGGRCGNSHCGGGICTRWGQIHHVAIYIGDGQIIESASGGVAINDIWETAKWKITFCARPYVLT